MNNYSNNWNSQTVDLSHLFTNDPAKKIRDAIANTGDYELLMAFAATNRLQAYLRLDKDARSDEIDHYAIKRNLMEEALIIRLRERGQNAH